MCVCVCVCVLCVFLIVLDALAYKFFLKIRPPLQNPGSAYACCQVILPLEFGWSFKGLRQVLSMRSNIVSPFFVIIIDHGNDMYTHSEHGNEMQPIVNMCNDILCDETPFALCYKGKS